MPLPMNADDVSKHLLVDWVPSLPVNVSSSFVGWPPYLLHSVPFQQYNALAVAKMAGRSDRQWKGFLSWMLGVAGTRHVLKREGYRWVAPLSAFYDDAKQPVDLARWRRSFRPGIVKATQPRRSRVRLRPDYVAIRSSAGTRSGAVIEWAVVESKGTRRCLTGCKKCPRAWHKQARNIEVTVRGEPLTTMRHLVVATRVNPNAKGDATRRIQIRAWNSVDDSRSDLPIEAAVDIATANIFGLLRNLRLDENAEAIARAPWRQSEPGLFASERQREELASLRDRANAELSREALDTEDEPKIVLQSDRGAVQVELAEPLLALIRALQRASDVQSAASELVEADVRLDKWENLRPLEDEQESGRRRLPFGVELHFPRPR